MSVGDLQETGPGPQHAVLSVACPNVWDYKREPCEAWGAPMSHGCQRTPGHTGVCVCPCGSRHARPQGGGS